MMLKRFFVVILALMIVTSGFVQASPNQHSEWEYRVIPVSEWLRMVYGKQGAVESASKAQQQLLNELGDQGWEMQHPRLPGGSGSYVFTRQKELDHQIWEYRVVGWDEWFLKVDDRQIDTSPKTLSDVQEEVLNELGAEGWTLRTSGTPGSLIFMRRKGTDAEVGYRVMEWEQLVQTLDENEIERAFMDNQEVFNELGASGWSFLDHKLPINSMALVFSRTEKEDHAWEYKVVSNDWSQTVENGGPEVQQQLLNEFGAHGWILIQQPILLDLDNRIFTSSPLGFIRMLGHQQALEYHVIGPQEWQEAVGGEWSAEAQEELLNELGVEGWKIADRPIWESIVFIRPVPTSPFQ